MAEKPDIPNPLPLFQLGTAFSASRVFLTAVELGLFTLLSRAPKNAAQIAQALNLHPRAVPDFPDALVALDLLKRDGEGPDALYSNSPLAAYYLVKGTPAYKGGLFEMCAKRLYSFWGHFTEALQTGRPQNEAHPRNGERNVWEGMYESEEKLEDFISAMAAVNSDAHRKFAQTTDWNDVKTHLDVGGASGQFSCEVVKAADHVKSITFDLERVSRIAEKNIEKQGLTDRIEIMSGSFWDDPFPKADVITMGQILHDYPLPKKIELLKKSFAALNPGGRFVAVEVLIDDDRRGPVPGLLMSLNMIVEMDGGFDFSAKDFDGWAKEVGFSRTERVDLVPPAAAVVAYK